MIKDLLSPLVLVGLMLAGGAIGGSFLFRELGKEAGCPEATTAESRDPDAQVLVDQAGWATAAAQSLRDDVHMYRVAPAQAGGAFYFLSPHEPPLIGPLLAVAFGRMGEPRAYEIHPNVLRNFELQGRVIQTLDDLMVGPSRARSVVLAQYPSADIQFAVLSRGTDCGLAWRVVGTISEEGKESLKLKAVVDNDADEVSLPDGPPAPYENLVDIIMPWN
jgi:hypothetical protein